MTYRIRVEHISRYSYAAPVESSYNELRITPLTTPRQLVLDSHTHVEPAAPIFGYVDYWGSVVHTFDLQQLHDHLVITGRSVVETDPVPATHEPSLSWTEVASPVVKDRFAEYLAPTAQVPVDAQLTSVATGIRADHEPLAAACAAMDWVRNELDYVQGSTAVHTSATEAWNGGEGVCQDFAHLMLALLRAMGLPARYCSGYMHPDGDAHVGQTVEGESHAWVECWTGEWEALDPTVGAPIGPHHVLVARGRDYSDVPPIKGIFHGGPFAGLDVTVALTRLA